jgi:hypothetical protein
MLDIIVQKICPGLVCQPSGSFTLHNITDALSLDPPTSLPVIRLVMDHINKS